MPNTPFKLGWLPEYPDYRDFPFKAMDVAVYPATKKLIWLTRLLDQFTAGSCVANAVASNIEYDRIQQRKLNAWTPSRLAIYFNAREARGWEGYDSGCFIRDAIKSVVDLGVVDETEWPYDLSKLTVRPPQPVYDSAINNKALVYRRIEQNLADMKNCIVQDRPFIFGFSVHDNFPWYGNGDVPMPKGSILGGHAVLAIGYDDASGMIDFQNSWGEVWGHGGRGRIPYEYLTSPEHSSDFWTISTVQ